MQHHTLTKRAQSEDGSAATVITLQCSCRALPEERPERDWPCCNWSLSGCCPCCRCWPLLAPPLIHHLGLLLTRHALELDDALELCSGSRERQRERERESGKQNTTISQNRRTAKFIMHAFCLHRSKHKDP